mgnify:FL=1
MNNKIMILDDEEEFCISTARILESKGFSVFFRTTSANIVQHLQDKKIELLLLDIRMPDANGIDLLKIIKTEFESLPIIIVSGHATIDITVQAMKYGALALYQKPLNIKKLVNELNIYFGQLPAGKEEVHTDIGSEIKCKDPEMLRIMEMIDTVAPTTATVLLTGESGTGKEILANRIHIMSDRRDKTFYKINCAALPEELLESQLFGHVKGAFTGAVQDKKGFFELASDGTILLDEIAEMGAKTQAKLLRVLQEKEFYPVGGTKVIKTDARVISSTNVDMQEALCKGTFREDIYYRLSVVSIHIPALRNRKIDIIPLAEFFVKQFSEKYNKKVTSIKKELKTILENHNWPGNIRELKNFIERLVIFSKSSELSFENIPNHYRERFDNIQETKDMSDYFDKLSKEKAREIIIEALKQSHGKKTEAAKLLNISRKTLYNRLKKYNIE